MPAPLLEIVLDRLASQHKSSKGASYVALLMVIPPGVRAGVDREMRAVSGSSSFIPNKEQTTVSFQRFYKRAVATRAARQARVNCLGDCCGSCLFALVFLFFLIFILYGGTMIFFRLKSLIEKIRARFGQF